MGFIYSVEKRRFEREWDKLRKMYQEAGMTAEAIQDLYEFDWDCFRSQRTYVNHTQPLPAENISDDEAEHSELFRKYANTSATFDESDFSGRYAWVDTIEDQKMALALRQLSNEDLELLTFLVLEEHTQRELAQKWGCSQKTISTRLKRIKGLLK